MSSSDQNLVNSIHQEIGDVGIINTSIPVDQQLCRCGQNVMNGILSHSKTQSIEHALDQQSMKWLSL